MVRRRRRYRSERPSLPRRSPVLAYLFLLDRSRAPDAALRPEHESSALDLGSPGLLDLLDDAVRHRDVVEFLGHLVAVLEGPAEELDGFLRGRLVGPFLVHEDEGRRRD